MRNENTAYRQYERQVITMRFNGGVTALIPGAQSNNPWDLKFKCLTETLKAQVDCKAQLIEVDL